MKGYSILPRSPELKSHYQIQFCVIPRTPTFWRWRVLPFNWSILSSSNSPNLFKDMPKINTSPSQIKKKLSNHSMLIWFGLVLWHVKYAKLATLVNGDPKASFSIATTPMCRGERYTIPRIAPLYPWSSPYNVEC